MINKMKIVNEFIRQIKKQGYRIELSDNANHHGYIYDDEKKLCILFKNGEISTNEYFDIRRTLNTVKEYIIAFENAEDLKVEGLRDGYKKLMDYNGYVFAMCETNHEYEFVTWQYSYDGKAVNFGHYFTDYENAKENMVTRCGLIDKSKMFTETEMKLIYTNLISYVGLDPNIEYKNEKAIGSVLDKIEDIVPEIVRHEKYEELELVSDDELEL
ncbi:MAG: hypothetical protein U9N10_10580 [Bacillota bacterium]|nr:hypothetical protein [Bacillota bacterium]